MRSRTSLCVAGVAALSVLVAARVSTPAAQGSVHSAGARVCGVERWTVKTLQDRPKLLPLQRTTVARLTSLPKPASLPATRLPLERHIFSVTASVTLVRREADQDLHLVLRSGNAHLIAEAPNAPTCTPNATAYRKRQMAAARQRVRICAHAYVVGVAFFDFLHGQTGVAPNGIELHPILNFVCLPAPT